MIQMIKYLNQKVYCMNKNTQKKKKSFLYLMICAK